MRPNYFSSDIRGPPCISYIYFLLLSFYNINSLAFIRDFGLGSEILLVYCWLLLPNSVSLWVLDFTNHFVYSSVMITDDKEIDLVNNDLLSFVLANEVNPNKC